MLLHIFLHIPKTAGSTLNHVLKYQYHTPQAIFTLDHPDPEVAGRAFCELPRKRREATRLLTGHCQFGIHRSLATPSSYFTLLRNPIDRVISHYYFVRHNPLHPDHSRMVQEKMTFEDYLNSRSVLMLENGQTRMLAGRNGVDYQADYGQCDEEVLAIAEKNLLKHFDVVGLQEEFDATLLLLQKAYGWRTPYYVTQNITQHRPQVREVSPETLDLIRSYNQIDLQLYECAAHRFHQKVAEHGPAFAAELEQFRAANRRYSLVYSAVKRYGDAAGRRLKQFIMPRK